MTPSRSPLLDQNAHKMEHWEYQVRHIEYRQTLRERIWSVKGGLDQSFGPPSIYILR